MVALTRSYIPSEAPMVELSKAMAAELVRITGIDDQTAVVVRGPCVVPCAVL